MTTNSSQPPLPPNEKVSVSCPHCAAHKAKPVSVSTGKAGETVRITMRCDDCQASWIVEKLTHDDPPQ